MALASCGCTPRCIRARSSCVVLMPSRTSEPPTQTDVYHDRECVRGSFPAVVNVPTAIQRRAARVIATLRRSPEQRDFWVDRKPLLEKAVQAEGPAERDPIRRALALAVVRLRVDGHIDHSRAQRVPIANHASDERTHVAATEQVFEAWHETHLAIPLRGSLRVCPRRRRHMIRGEGSAKPDQPVAPLVTHTRTQARAFETCPPGRAFVRFSPARGVRLRLVVRIAEQGRLQRQLDASLFLRLCRT